jgi:hypothetical protein
MTANVQPNCILAAQVVHDYIVNNPSLCLAEESNARYAPLSVGREGEIAETDVLRQGSVREIGTS